MKKLIATTAAILLIAAQAAAAPIPTAPTVPPAPTWRGTAPAIPSRATVPPAPQRVGAAGNIRLAADMGVPMFRPQTPLRPAPQVQAVPNPRVAEEDCVAMPAAVVDAATHRQTQQIGANPMVVVWGFQHQNPGCGLKPVPCPKCEDSPYGPPSGAFQATRFTGSGLVVLPRRMLLAVTGLCIGSPGLQPRYGIRIDGTDLARVKELAASGAQIVLPPRMALKFWQGSDVPRGAVAGMRGQQRSIDRGDN